MNEFRAITTLPGIVESIRNAVKHAAENGDKQMNRTRVNLSELESIQKDIMAILSHMRNPVVDIPQQEIGDEKEKRKEEYEMFFKDKISVQFNVIAKVLSKVHSEQTDSL
ncbi:MAG: hypothetical protein QW597_05315 [Thermoplasmataceae archaeon]